MDNKRSENSELEELLARKQDLLSLFSAFENRIDHRISHLADSVELPTAAVRAKLDRDAPNPVANDEDIFEQAVLKSQQKSKNEGIVGYHTEEILGIDAALATMDAPTTPDFFAETLVVDTDSITPTEPPISQPFEDAPKEIPLSQKLEVPEDAIFESLEQPLAQEPLHAESSMVETPLDVLGPLGSSRIELADTPTEVPFDDAAPDFSKFDLLFEESEDLFEDMPERPYTDSPSAVEKKIQATNPLNLSDLDLTLETNNHEESLEFLGEDKSHLYDALFDDDAPNDDFLETNSLEDAAPKEEVLEDLSFEEDTFFEEDDLEDTFGGDEPLDDMPFEDSFLGDENLDDASLDPFFEDEHLDDPSFEPEDTEPKISANIFDQDLEEMPLGPEAKDKAPKASSPLDNEDTIPPEDMDTVPLGAFKYSAVSLKLALFVIAMLGMGVFTAFSGGKFMAPDYLILMALCIFTALTMDMSFTATLIVAAVLALANLGNIFYQFSTGAGFSLYTLLWFLVIPAVLISASVLVQKIKEIVLANQLLNEELDRYCPVDDAYEDENLD